MNKENIRKLADHIEGLPFVPVQEYEESNGPAFNMQTVTFDCGSPACIIGHCEALFSKGLRYGLSLHAGQPNELSMPDGYLTNPEEFTPERVARTLRNLAETGMVDWNA